MIIFKKQAKKELSRIPMNIRKRIIVKIDQLASDPASLASNIKKLKGNDNFRLRVGDYRIIFNNQGIILNILRIAPRGSIYN